ncbi:hypothetical protein EFK50_02995 [Nocardioides marmoriginsengisoli]|uniref:DUF4352 domain-containing protein n=1 Tax=Nocardioides marmoriginsengisoli TaxID=661483 RepID=A0A3N0CNN2_9ACTN|nr:hypothetical protein [Nocardioides marmoriginsengisoli]RNL64960.1 hypothetical protein EFK50_02995 [Nocardioides marmoriginsengisoli]
MIVRTHRSLLTLPVAALVAALTLAGCGGQPEKKAGPSADANAQTEVPVPTGIELTDFGSELKFGEAARVAYAPNEQRKSVLELTVLSATQGTIGDLSGYSLEERTRNSTPYYVQVKVKNVGDGDVGQTPIPLYLVDNRTPKTLIIASSFTNSFTKCPSTKLPTTFAPQAELSTCLVYLAPDHGTMTGVSFRGADQKGDPILWTGTVTVPQDKKKAS